MAKPDSHRPGGALQLQGGSPAEASHVRPPTSSPSGPYRAGDPSRLQVHAGLSHSQLTTSSSISQTQGSSHLAPVPLAVSPCLIVAIHVGHRVIFFPATCHPSPLFPSFPEMVPSFFLFVQCGYPLEIPGGFLRIHMGPSP